ncbi:MAG: hypothetical protein EA384_10450 [Spirochaetaceae bacterium]|nr:MAG: hypothetical protein EA384_10450 [Spirochaetaceae bacterium]
MEYGNMADAFRALRDIAEDGGDLREWAIATAELLGEESNLDSVWPEFREYYTVDVPHRTVKLRATTEHAAGSYGQPVLVDEHGQAYDHWMVRPL